MNKFWGMVVQEGDELYIKELGGRTILNIPDWVKTKIAMLDLMELEVRLPCGSLRRVMHAPLLYTDLWACPSTYYYIYEEKK